MKSFTFQTLVAVGCAWLAVSCTKPAEITEPILNTVGNPFLPLWEHIPDGEPYVFEDPDHPSKLRVYLYGSHDNLKTMYCGRDQVVWSASVDDLNHWRYDGIILQVDKNALGEPFDSAGTADVLYAPDVTLVTDANGKKTYYLYPNDQAGGRNGLIAKTVRMDLSKSVTGVPGIRIRRRVCSNSIPPCLWMTTDGFTDIGASITPLLRNSTPPQWLP